MFTAFELGIIALSLKVAAVSIVAAMPLAFGCAWLLARCTFPGKTLLGGIIDLPLALPPVVVGYALLTLFGARGPIGGFLNAAFGVTLFFTWKGAALAAAVMAMPLMVRTLRLSLEAGDPRLEGMARTLGASRTRVFRTITLPLAAPGLVAVTVMGFARSLGEFGATITFVSSIPGETETLPLAIYALIQTPGAESGAFRLALISIALALLAMAASEWLAQRLPRGAATPS